MNRSENEDVTLKMVKIKHFNRFLSVAIALWLKFEMVFVRDGVCASERVRESESVRESEKSVRERKTEIESEESMRE